MSVYDSLLKSLNVQPKEMETVVAAMEIRRDELVTQDAEETALILPTALALHKGQFTPKSIKTRLFQVIRDESSLEPSATTGAVMEMAKDIQEALTKLRFVAPPQVISRPASLTEYLEGIRKRTSIVPYMTQTSMEILKSSKHTKYGIPKSLSYKDFTAPGQPTVQLRTCTEPIFHCARKASSLDEFEALLGAIFICDDGAAAGISAFTPLGPHCVRAYIEQAGDSGLQSWFGEYLNKNDVPLRTLTEGVDLAVTGMYSSESSEADCPVPKRMRTSFD
jgi:hypothetical protein